MLNPEGGDRTDIRLPESQREFIRLMRENVPDKPIIAVITGGSAIALQEVLEAADAVLFAWYPGEQGGTALANILFGDENPSGRLPVTFYKSLDDLPPYDDYSMENRTYKYFKGEPLFPFGFGLSYTTFDYIGSAFPEPPLPTDVKYDFTLTVRNSGNRAGEEVILVYARNTGEPMGKEGFYWPGKEKSLVGFERVYLEAGETKEVPLSIDLNNLHQWNAEAQKYEVKKGAYILDMEPCRGSGFWATVEVR
jgi:beta-glucosidase